MKKIFEPTDYEKVLKGIKNSWNSLDLPHRDLPDMVFRMGMYRNIGLHSMLNIGAYGKGGEPLYFFKMPRYAGSSIAPLSLKHEMDIISSLKTAVPCPSFTPEVFGIKNITDIPVLISRAYKGQMLHKMIDSETDTGKLGKLIGLGSELMLSFSKTGREFLLDDTFIDTYLIKPAKQVCEYYPGYIGATEKAIEHLSGSADFKNLKVPNVFCHNDFNPWNILLDEKGPVVLFDYEDSIAQGLPFLDLFNYFEISFRLLFSGETEESRAFGNSLKKNRILIFLESYESIKRDYCRKFGLPEELSSLFFLVFIINMASMFLDEKRKAVGYAQNWLYLLDDALTADPLRSYFDRLTSTL